MTLRILSAQDAEVMATLHAACFDKPWPALDMAVHVTRDLCLGIGEPLSSFAILRHSDIDAEILTVATDPAVRGQGLAAEVLRAAEDHYRVAGLRHIFLEVAEDNVSARSLYERLGFAPMGRRPGYYARPTGRVAAITYSRNLESDRAAPLDVAPDRG